MDCAQAIGQIMTLLILRLTSIRLLSTGQVRMFFPTFDMFSTFVSFFRLSTDFITSYNVSVSAISMPSAFSNFYSIQSIGVVTEIFGTVFPIVLFIVMGLFVLNIFNRILVLLKLEGYQFGQRKCRLTLISIEVTDKA